MLHTLKGIGTKYTMNDDMKDIAFEFNRYKIEKETKDNVRFMGDMLKFGINGLEMLSNKVGILKLNGWADSVTSDMDRYKPSLERIYKKIWRRGSVNPFLELGILLVGSAVMFHVKNSLLQSFISPPEVNKPRKSRPSPRDDQSEPSKSTSTTDRTSDTPVRVMKIPTIKKSDPINVSTYDPILDIDD